MKNYSVLMFFYRFDYHSVINCKSINDFFQINRLFIINANNLLEKLSEILKKHIANDKLTEDEKKLLFKKKDTNSNNVADNSKLIIEKDEEILKYKNLLEGNLRDFLILYQFSLDLLRKRSNNQKFKG